MSSSALKFDHFEVKTDESGLPIRLGPGGMGTTYRAYDTRLRKIVALKLISEKLLEDPTSRLRFFNEARAAALIDHPNVARVLYLCPEDALQCFFAMELVEGESLAHRVARHGPLSPTEALLLLRPVADALITLGEHHLVHRDLKPENIMLAHTGSPSVRVKLIDFGLAKSVASAEDRFADVQTGDRFIGSVYFASPEQTRSRDQLDARSDFYSLGATLWHVLTGFPPFTGTVFEVQEAHVYREPPWEKIDEAPAPVKTLLRRLLAKKREDRPPNAYTLLEKWDEAIAGLEEDRATAARPLPSAVAAAAAAAELAHTRLEGAPAEAAKAEAATPAPVDEAVTVSAPRKGEPSAEPVEKRPRAPKRPPPPARPPLSAATIERMRIIVLLVCGGGVLIAALIFVKALFSPLPVPEPLAAVAKATPEAVPEATPIPVATPIPIATPIPMNATPSPQAVETPAPPERSEEEKALREKIAQFAREYIGIVSFDDAATVAKFFAPTVDYLEEGKLDRARILSESEEYNGRWPERSQTVDGDLFVTLAADRASAWVDFQIKFDVRKGESYIRGKTADRITIDLRSPNLQITAVKSTVIERDKGGPPNNIPGSHGPPAASPPKFKPAR